MWFLLVYRRGGGGCAGRIIIRKRVLILAIGERDYLWPVSRSIQGKVAGSLMWSRRSDMVPTNLQIRFQLGIVKKLRVFECNALDGAVKWSAKE